MSWRWLLCGALYSAAVVLEQTAAAAASDSASQSVRMAGWLAD